MDLRNLVLQSDRYTSFIVMGNTLGIHQTPESLPALLRTLECAARPRAWLLCVMLDPLDTKEPSHLKYHQRNRERGRPPRLTVMRLRYRELIDDWVRLWMPTGEEFQRVLSATRWHMVEEKAHGPHRLRLLELRDVA